MVVSAQDFQKVGAIADAVGAGEASSAVKAPGKAAAASGFLAKAHIIALEPPGTSVFFMFNPSKYTVKRSLEWSMGGQMGVDVPDAQFAKGKGRTIQLELFADEYESGPRGTVLGFVQKLESLTLVNQANKGDGTKARPPQLLFGWGDAPKLKVVITSLDVTYTLFHPGGLPARATISLGLQEVKKVEGPTDESSTQNVTTPQNPTSGGEAGRRSHVVLPGETLDLIAYQELGDTRRWAHIAETNGIDNPFAIRPGQSLTIVPVR